jgi:hypothetical protein
MSTVQNNVKRKTFPSDISKNGWKNLKKLLPPSKSNDETGGRIPVDLKEVKTEKGSLNFINVNVIHYPLYTAESR